MGGILGGGGGTSINTTEPVAAGLRIQTSAYGMAVPIVYGHTRVPGNLIWYGDFTPIPHTTTTSSGGGGGKGGGGEVSSSNTTYTYTASFALGLCEGPIAGVTAFWRDKEYVANAAWYKTTNVTIWGVTIPISVPQPPYFSIYTGTYPQASWDYLQSRHPDQAVPYQGMAYAAAAAYDLGSNASLPNHTFEVFGQFPFSPDAGIYDAVPTSILVDFINNAHYGAIPGWNGFGDLTQFSTYCIANGILLSPCYTEQVAAGETITNLARIANSAIFYSEGVLKIAPYGDASATGNGVTYSPISQAQYDLTDDDFIVSGDEDPVRLLRKPSADSYNQVQVEFVNRYNQYNAEVAEAKDQVSIDTYGLRPMEPIKAHEIADPGVARNVAQLILQRSLYTRNQYEFTLGWKYCLLEPMDIVTITDSMLGLVRQPVRILSVEENDNGDLAIIAEDYLAGVNSSPVYGSQTAQGYSANFNASPGNTNAPIIFEAPAVLTTTGLEVWFGASGGAQWGGCEVWVSQDGATYQRIGVITTPARQGILTAALPSGSDPDVTNTLAVSTAMSNGQLSPGSQLDADSYNTLCYVDGELVSYRDAALTSANNYNLGYLRRGAYNTAISSHADGASFMRIDGAVFKLPFTSDRIGQQIYIKLPSFNIYGAGNQALSDVQPYTYRLTGSALASPLPVVQNLATNFVSGITQIYWDPVQDIRQPNIDYEVRMGATWATGTVVGRTPLTQFPSVGDGTYWVSAHYMTSGGVNVYSSSPAEIVLAGAILTKNVVASYDQAALSWPGLRSQELAVVGGGVLLQGAGNILAEANILTTPDVLWYGGVSASGIYTLPAAETVDIGRVAPCTVSMSYNVVGQSIYDNVLTMTNVLAVSDFLGAALGVKVGVKPQIAIAGDDGVFGAWQDFVPGMFNARYFKARAIITSSDPTVTALVTGFTFSVDVPDRVDEGVVSVLAAGMTITYTSPFNGGSNGLPYPGVQVTIVNAQAGDDVMLSGQSKNGFTVQVMNGGIGVARTINWLAQGY